MEIIQIIGIAIISTILCLFIKKDRPEFANFIAITAGVIILLSVILKLNFSDVLYLLLISNQMDSKQLDDILSPNGNRKTAIPSD